MSSTTDTLENDHSHAAAEPGHSHEGHDHDHGHDHEHAHTHLAMNPECTKELVLDVPAAEVDKAYKRVTASYRKYARIPGFRPGKVPETVVKSRFAAEIRKEVIDALLPERFNKGVAELGVKPVGQPQVNELTMEEGQPLHVKAAFEYIPDFSIEGYKDIVVEKSSSELTEEEFANEMAQMRDSRATFEPVEEERAILDGDWVQITYTGTISGEPDAPPVSGQDALVEVGGKTTLEAFTTVLRGAKVGQELKAEVTYPEEYAEPKLAGKTATYEIQVTALKTKVLPEINDEFAKEMGNYESVAELENRVREYLGNRKRRAVAGETKERLFSALAARYTFAVPESMVQDQIETRLERGLRALAAQGMTAEAMRKLDFARLREAQRDSALAEVKTGILLDRIASEEQIDIGEEELDRELQMAALQTREPIDVLRARLTEEGGLERLKVQMRQEKAGDLLVERLPG